MPLRLSAPHAALVNGSLIQSFELDDVYRVGVLHVGAVTLPAVGGHVYREAPRLGLGIALPDHYFLQSIRN